MLEGSTNKEDKEEDVNDKGDAVNSAEEWQEFSAAPSAMTLPELYRNFQKQMADNVLARSPKDNELTRVQFLRERLSVAEKAVLEKDEMYTAGKDITEKDIHDVAKLQGHQISAYQTLNDSFLASLEKNQHYIQLVRHALDKQDVTPENVRAIIVDWKQQLDTGLMVASGAESASSSEASEAQYPIPLNTSSFRAFVHHCARSKFADLTHDVQYSKPHNELGKYDYTLAEDLWAKIEATRYSRLETNVKGIMPRVKKWLDIIPQALSYKEMDEREQLTPFKMGESKEYREERKRQVPGHEPSMEQKQDKAVARAVANAFAKERETLRKQHCELPDPIRIEMQFNLGVIPISKSRQSYFSAARKSISGSQQWQTEFKGHRLADEALISFPERKASAAKVLTPHYQLGRIAANKQLTDPSESVDPAVAEMTENLRKFKIGS